MEIDKFLNEFGDWLKKTNDFENYISKKVNQKVFPNTTKISKKIILDMGNLEEVTNDFIKHGGIIIKEDKEEILIEVNSGTFYLNKKYVY